MHVCVGVCVCVLDDAVNVVAFAPPDMGKGQGRRACMHLYMRFCNPNVYGEVRCSGCSEACCVASS